MRTTPTGWAGHCDPVPSHPANTAAWLAERRKGIGASEVSTILGFNAYSSPYDLWEEKTGERPDRDRTTPQAIWGHRMEPYIRQDVITETGRDVTTCGSVVSKRWPWLRCSPDGVFTDDGALLEIKTTGFFQRDQWAGGQVADHAELQVQAQLAVTGAPYAIVAVVIDRGELQLRRVERDDDILIPLIVDETRAFWDLVVSGTPPQIDGSAATRDALAARFDSHDAPDVVDEDGEAEKLADQYRQADAIIRDATEKKNQAANRLRALIAHSRRIVTTDGAPIASIRGGRVNETRLRDEHPDLAEKYATTRPAIDTASLKADHHDIYTAMQFTSISVSKGAA